jgi:hypothetical protein
LAFEVHVGNSQVDGAIEMIDVAEGLMGEEVALQIAPGSLDVVQFRGIFRQPFDRQPSLRSERGAGGFAGVDRAIIEHQDDRFLWAPRTWPADRVGIIYLTP